MSLHAVTQAIRHLVTYPHLTAAQLSADFPSLDPQQVDELIDLYGAPEPPSVDDDYEAALADVGIRPNYEHEARREHERTIHVDPTRPETIEAAIAQMNRTRGGA